MDKRAQKRWMRENRPNKGANTEAARQAHNAAVRAARQRVGYVPDMSEQMLLAAASMVRVKR